MLETVSLTYRSYAWRGTYSSCGNCINITIARGTKAVTEPSTYRNQWIQSVTCLGAAKHGDRHRTWSWRPAGREIAVNEPKNGWNTADIGLGLHDELMIIKKFQPRVRPDLRLLRNQSLLQGLRVSASAFRRVDLSHISAVRKRSHSRLVWRCHSADRQRKIRGKTRLMLEKRRPLRKTAGRM